MTTYNALGRNTTINEHDSTITLDGKQLLAPTTVPGEYITSYDIHKHTAIGSRVIVLHLDHPSFVPGIAGKWPEDPYVFPVKKKQADDLTQALDAMIARTSGHKRPYSVAPRQGDAAKAAINNNVGFKNVTWFGDIAFDDSYLYHQAIRTPISEVKAKIESEDVLRGQMSAGRVVGGYVLLGPVGALLGGMAKKNKKRIYLTISFSDGTAVVTAGEEHSRRNAEKLVAMVGEPTETQWTAGNGLDDLTKLAELHASGVLTDEEFTAAKKKALGL